MCSKFNLPGFIRPRRIALTSNTKVQISEQEMAINSLRTFAEMTENIGSKKIHTKEEKTAMDKPSNLFDFNVQNEKNSVIDADKSPKRAITPKEHLGTKEIPSELKSRVVQRNSFPQQKGKTTKETKGNSAATPSQEEQQASTKTFTYVASIQTLGNPDYLKYCNTSRSNIFAF